MAKKKTTSKKPKKKRLGMIGGVHEGTLRKISSDIASVQNSLEALVEKAKATRIPAIKQSLKQQIHIRKTQLRNLMKDQKKLLR